MPLSDREIKHLLKKVESSLELGKIAEDAGDVPLIKKALKEAIGYYNQVIENAPHSYYFSERAEIKYRLAYVTPYFSFDDAIEDINRAIELDPQKSLYYLRRAEYSLEKLSRNYEMPQKYRKRLLEGIISDYKTSLEKDPSSSDVWLALIAANIIQQDLDNAISLYGSCRPYIQEKEDQLCRSYLGCLALALAGDLIEEEDKQPLYDKTICLEKMRANIAIISSFLKQIRQREEYRGKSENALIIHELFVSHLSPFDRAEAFDDLGDYEKALVEIDKVLELDPNNSMARNHKRYYLACLKRSKVSKAIWIISNAINNLRQR